MAGREERAMRYAWCAVSAVLFCALVSGCGDDDDDDGTTPAPDGGGGKDAAVPGGGSGGSSGSGSRGSGAGGTGGRSGSGGSSGSSSAVVECGDKTCQAAGGPVGFATACCMDAATSTCGVSAMGGPCSSPPEPDPRCPSVNVGGGIFTLASCC